MSVARSAAMRILVVHSSDEMYGADRMLMLVLEALLPLVEVEVLLPDDVRPTGASLLKALEELGYSARRSSLPILRHAYMTPRGILGLLQRCWRLYRRIREFRPDVVWCATSAALLGAPIARFAGVRRVVLHNQEIWGEAERTILGSLGRAVTSVIAVSAAARDSLPRHMAQRTVVINNATAAPVETMPPPKTEVPTFLIASRWNAWKGHRTLLRAWKAAGAPGALLVAGGPPPMGESTDVASVASELGIAESVHVVGEQSSIDQLIDRSHFVVVPSDNPEPFGLVAIEALSRGRPVIASRGGGLGEIVVDEVSGLLFDNGDEAGLAALLRAASVQLSSEMSSAARARYEEAYSEAAFIESIRSYWKANA